MSKEIKKPVPEQKNVYNIIEVCSYLEEKLKLKKRTILDELDDGLVNNDSVFPLEVIDDDEAEFYSEDYIKYVKLIDEEFDINNSLFIMSW